MMLLSQKSKPADKSDLQTATDLLDTLRANSDRCVGMAANMIGVLKRIIAVNTGMGYLIMLNPVITAKSKDSYETKEGCLSLLGERKTVRYQSISVEYQDLQMKKCRGTFSGYTAQIIQHEIDHCNGILI